MLDGNGLMLMQTFVDYGSRQGAGLSDPKKILDAIWSNFSGQAAKRAIDGAPLTYWKGWIENDRQHPDGPVTFAGSSQYLVTGPPGFPNVQDGQCGAWQELLMAAIYAQGLPSDQAFMQNYPIQAVKITAKNSDELMLIGKWDFPTDPIHSGPYYFENSVKKPAYRYVAATKQWVYDWSGDPEVPFVPANSPKGQNNANPRGDFPNHALVKIGDYYYDPSYGVYYSSLADFQDRAVAGFAIQEGAGPNTTKVRMRKAPPGDPWLEVQATPA
jgi:hypothetical protein